MKKTLALILALVMVAAILAGCSAKTAPAETTTASDTTATTETPAASTDSSATYTLKLGHDHTTTSPFQTCALAFKDQIEKESNGRITVEIYPAQSIGSSREMIEMMQMGTLEATLLPTAKFGGFDQRLNLADMPFLAETEEDFMAIMNGEIGREAMSGLEAIGIKGMAYFPEGYKYITNNKHTITCPDDLKGLKIRTMEAPIIMSMFKAWGANPVPIDFSEVYNSLQQGVVDGQENPLLSIHDMRFYEVQDYMTIDTHAYLSYFLSFSKAWFDSLPADLQEIVTNASMDAADYCHELMVEANTAYLKTIEDSGTEIYTLSEEETAAFKEACQKAGPTLLEPIMKVSVIVPDEYMGDVIGDLNSRRGQIQGFEARSGAQQIDAFVPLAEMFGYATDLRSRTQGRGQYTMEPSHYIEIPKSIQEKIIDQRTGRHMS